MPVVTINLWLDEEDREVPVECDVTVVKPWKGSAMSAPSDLDYTGYEEAEILSCPIELTAEQEEKAKEQAIIAAFDSIAERQAEREDYEYEQWKERRYES